MLSKKQIKSFSMPGYSLFTAGEGTNPKTASRTAIESIGDDVTIIRVGIASLL